MSELSDREALKGRDLILGGIVTDYREGINEEWQTYGIIKMEDFTGSGRFFRTGIISITANTVKCIC